MRDDFHAIGACLDVLRGRTEPPEGDTSHEVSEAAFRVRWAMDQLAEALKLLSAAQAKPMSPVMTEHLLEMHRTKPSQGGDE